MGRMIGTASAQLIGTNIRRSVALMRCASTVATRGLATNRRGF